MSTALGILTSSGSRMTHTMHGSALGPSSFPRETCLSWSIIGRATGTVACLARFRWQRFGEGLRSSVGRGMAIPFCHNGSGSESDFPPAVSASLQEIRHFSKEVSSWEFVYHLIMLVLSSQAGRFRERFVFDQRVRKAFSEPSSSLFRLTQAHSSQGLHETRTLAGVSWNELE